MGSLSRRVCWYLNRTFRRKLNLALNTLVEMQYRGVLTLALTALLRDVSSQVTGRTRSLSILPMIIRG